MEMSKVVSLVQEATRNDTVVQCDMDGLASGVFVPLFSAIVLGLGTGKAGCEERLPSCLCPGKPHSTECRNSHQPVFTLVAR